MTTTTPAETATEPLETFADAATTTIETTTIETTTVVTTTSTTTTTSQGTTIEIPQVSTVTETTPVTTTIPVPVATTGEPSSSSSDTPWGWIALGFGILAALLIALLLWHRSRAGASSWAARLNDLAGRALVTLDDVLAQGSVVTGQVEALAAEAAQLEARAPDAPAKTEAARLRGHLDELAATLEADRTLHLSSPPPTEEQLSYSAALIRQQAEQLRGVLRPPPPPP